MNIDSNDISTILSILANSPLGIVLLILIIIIALIFFGFTAYLFFYRKLKANSDLSVKSSMIDLSILERLYHEIERKDKVIANLRDELEVTRNALSVANSDKTLLVSNLKVAHEELERIRIDDLSK